MKIPEGYSVYVPAGTKVMQYVLPEGEEPRVLVAGEFVELEEGSMDVGIIRHDGTAVEFHGPKDLFMEWWESLS